MFRIAHYQNHFFGQSGRGEHIGMEPACREGAFGPGQAFSGLLADVGGIALTIVGGDDYMFLNMERGVRQVVRALARERADALLAGPAFNAGRYGMACAAVCRAAAEELGIPAVTGMTSANPGAAMASGGVSRVETASSIAGMREALPAMSSLLRAALLNPEAVTAPALPAGPPLQETEAVVPAPPIRAVARARLALVTEGGLVPAGNPAMQGANAVTRFYRYPLDGLRELAPGAYKTMHGGVDRAVINASPERLLPLSVFKSLERRGKIGSVADYFWSTTGNGVSAEDSRAMGRDLAAALRADAVDGVLLTAT